MSEVDLSAVALQKPHDVHVIVGRVHQSQAVDDIVEVFNSAGPELEFGLAYLQVLGASPPKSAGNAADLNELAASNIATVGVGHLLIIFLRGG